jgi:hypothetical protein
MMGEDEEFRPQGYFEGSNPFHQFYLFAERRPRFPESPGHKKCLGKISSKFEN